MPKPLNKSSYAKYPYAGLHHLNQRERNQYGVDNEALKGQVVSNYVAQFGSATSIMRRISDQSAVGYACLTQLGSGLLNPNRYGFAAARNKAYSKFKYWSTGDQSALATAIAEWRQTFNLMADAFHTAANATRQFRRNQYSRAINTVINPGRRSPPRNHNRTAAGRASAAWLTYWFGISPTLGDIVTAAQQLSDLLPEGNTVTGTARENIYELSGGLQKVELTGVFKVTTGARVSLRNPNLFLANQLGLLNPVSVAWEIIPYSFILDWCFDVSSFIESFTDFIGVDIEMAFRNEKISGTTATWRPDVYTGRWVSHQVQFRRDSGLIRPTPNTNVRANIGYNITRAASGASLLTQQVLRLAGRR